MSILPPGENGLVNATDALAFETTQQRPAEQPGPARPVRRPALRLPVA